MTESPAPPIEPNVPDEQFATYVPDEADRDTEAEDQMQMGRTDLDPNNALFDPWFDDADQAATWTPDSEEG
jgi:hypothetical protein